MKRTLLQIATIAIVLGLLLAGTAGAATVLSESQTTQAVTGEDVHFAENNTTTTTDETVEDDGTPNDSVTISPGARLSGIVGTQQAELEGAVSERAFGLSVAAAVSNGSKAGLVVDETEQLETRLQELERSMEQLKTAYDNETIANGTYHARAATLNARITAMERMINRTAAVGEQLPEDVRQQYRVNTTRLAELKTKAGNLTGPEVAEIARTIAGPRAGHPSAERGPPPFAGPGETTGPSSNGTTGINQTTRGPPTNNTRGTPNDGTTGPPESITMGPRVDRGQDTPNNRTADNRSTGTTPSNGIMTNDWPGA